MTTTRPSRTSCHSLLLVVLLACCTLPCWSLAPPRPSVQRCSRRDALVVAALAVSLPATAIPMVTTAEFQSILKDSSRSVSLVKFAGPQSTLVTVRLIDGTIFQISDVIESSTDPRSPLKLAADCRLYKVPTQFDLGITTTKRKIYSNAAVREAAEKEKIKQQRMQEDEQARLKALYEQQEAMATKQQ